MSELGTLIGFFGVDSGQAMVGDPCYLDQWGGDDRSGGWAIENHKGEFNYQGACEASCNEQQAGVLGNGDSVVFATGYGDGQYPVFVEYNGDNRVSRVTIVFDGSWRDEDYEEQEQTGMDNPEEDAE